MLTLWFKGEKGSRGSAGSDGFLGPRGAEAGDVQETFSRKDLQPPLASFPRKAKLTPKNSSMGDNMGFKEAIFPLPECPLIFETIATVELKF